MIPSVGITERKKLIVLSTDVTDQKNIGMSATDVGLLIGTLRKRESIKGGRPMSVYAEYLHAETDEERRVAYADMMAEVRREEYLDRLAEERQERESEEDDEED